MIKSYTSNSVLPTNTVAAPAKGKFEHNLEGLRGFAALLVVWCHAIGFKLYLDPGFTAIGPLAYQPPAHFSVLIFFVLSGFVIGVSNKVPLTAATIGTYCRKRLVRIYPLYIISIAVALLVATQHYSLLTILGNLTFLQVAAVPVIWENNPIWSLNSEVLFYALFIPVSALRLDSTAVIVTALAIGLLNRWLLPTHPLLSTYAFGFTFWMCGLIIAQYRALLPTVTASNRLLLSTLLLFFSFRTFNYLDEVLHKLADLFHAPLYYLLGTDVFEGILPPADLASLPYAVVGVILFIGKQFPGSRIVLPVLWLLPALTLVAMGRHWHELPDPTPYLVSALFYLLAVLFYFAPAAFFERIGAYVMSKLIWLGSISYGLYIIHYPLLCLFKRISVFSGSPSTFVVRFALFITLSIAAAWLLETKVQPFAKRFLPA
jgi:peptidoglycan/LPS O-acetylase OafA/YrhL